MSAATILPRTWETTPAYRLAEAQERISAIAEGRYMLDFLKDQNIAVVVSPCDARGHLDWFGETITINEDQSAAEMASVLTHEIYHGIQLANTPALVAAAALFLKGFDFPPDQHIDVLRPRDLPWAFNLMEMGAYAVQTDFAVQLAERAGDRDALENTNLPVSWLSRAYFAARDKQEPFAMRANGVKYMVVDAAEDRALYDAFRRDYATAAAAHEWFWGGRMGGLAVNRHYNAPLMRMIGARARNPLTPVFQAAATGNDKLLRFVAWERGDAVRMGHGYPVNPLDVPCVADIAHLAYRKPMTKDSCAIIGRMERLLGAQAGPV